MISGRRERELAEESIHPLKADDWFLITERAPNNRFFFFLSWNQSKIVVFCNFESGVRGSWIWRVVAFTPGDGRENGVRTSANGLPVVVVASGATWKCSSSKLWGNKGGVFGGWGKFEMEIVCTSFFYFLRNDPTSFSRRSGWESAYFCAKCFLHYSLGIDLIPRV